jgi:hypothetical protein
MLFLENVRARRGDCLPAASGTDWRCRVGPAKANVGARRPQAHALENIDSGLRVLNN